MPFDINLARTNPEFTIKKQGNGTSASPEEKIALITALLENKNLLKVNDLRNDFSEQERKRLDEHITNNTRALLKHSHIDVSYTCSDDTKRIRKSNFRFDDPSFYKSKNITFADIELADGISDADLKTAALKLFILNELLRCTHLKECRFLMDTNKAKPFLNHEQTSFLKRITYRNKHYLSKYQFDWPRWTGIVFGVVGLATIALPGFGILKGLLSAAFLFVGGVNVGAAISYFREKFLFKVGYHKLQELKDNKMTSNGSITDSLITGENSKHWKGYFSSFLNWKTYSPQNYPAYAAGLFTGVNRLKDQKEAIKKLRPN